jgi:hypothetical protein
MGVRWSVIPAALTKAKLMLTSALGDRLRLKIKNSARSLFGTALFKFIA